MTNLINMIHKHNILTLQLQKIGRWLLLFYFLASWSSLVSQTTFR